MAGEYLEVEWRETSSGGPQLDIEVPTKAALAKFAALFRKLAEGPVSVRLADYDFVRLKNIKELYLE